MAEMKPPGAQGLHGHALRDFYRGAMTKNLVKGADGGARGVDFQDLEGENKDKEANKAKGGSAQSSASKRRSPAQEKQAQESGATPENILQEMLAANQLAKTESTVQEVESQDQRQQKKKSVTQQAREDSQQHQDDADPAATDGATSELMADPTDAAHQASILQSIAKLLADPTTERRAFGAMALTDPELMKKTLGSPVRVAKHLLVLSSRMVEQGRPREDVLNYLTQTFLALGTDFGKRAFKDFSVNIGIGTFYPLEIRERLLLADDDFLPTIKCRFTSTRRMLATKVKEMVVLEYPEDMTLTEFAVKGGTRNGYVLAPLKEKGKHGLRFFEPGEYKVLLMGHDAMGIERMEEIKVDVTGASTARPAPVEAKAPAKFSFDRLKRSREAQGGKPPGIS